MLPRPQVDDRTAVHRVGERRPELRLHLRVKRHQPRHALLYGDKRPAVHKDAGVTHPLAPLRGWKHDRPMLTTRLLGWHDDALVAGLLRSGNPADLDANHTRLCCSANF